MTSSEEDPDERSNAGDQGTAKMFHGSVSKPNELTATHMVGYLYQEFSKWGPWTPAVVMRGSGFFPTRGSRFYEIIRPAPHHCIYFYNPPRTRDH